MEPVMRLNPEELEVMSFDTDATTQYPAITLQLVDTGYPTPQTYCLVCD
jgi:hypothetical protein